MGRTSESTDPPSILHSKGIGRASIVRSNMNRGWYLRSGTINASVGTFTVRSMSPMLNLELSS